MFYVNNEQVKGIFLNGRNYNYLAYGFSKIIPEDRNSVQANLNLAYKHLNQYRIKYGTVKDGYDNALVSPRVDEPDSKGVFHAPFTYYYNGNIIPTKEVNILITNGNHALMNALVYNDMNINGAINYFATNTDFQGHNVNTYLEGFGSSQSYFDSTVMNNCSNFHLRSLSRFSKGSEPTLYNCNNFSGWFNFVRGDDGTRYPGFRGFLYQCRDGSFNINCKNMHGGGSAANVTNYYNFSGIQSCNNIKLNITGSSWQAWVHPNCYSSNCNINTRYIVPGFGRMSDCNFNIYLPSNAEVEKSAHYSILSNSTNCNIYFDGTNSNLSSFLNYDRSLFLFEDLNNCNFNLALSNSAGIDYGFGNRLNNCNIKFDSIDFVTYAYGWFNHINNCNITGNVILSKHMGTGLVTDSTNVNLNINASSADCLWPVWNSSYINGNIIMGNLTWVNHGNNLILNLYNGNTFEAQNVNDSKFELNKVNNVHIYGSYNTNFNMRVGNAYFNNLNNVYARVNNVTFRCNNINHTEIYGEGSKTSILGADNCYNLTLSGLTFKTPDSDSLFENIYNSNLKFGTVAPYYRLWCAANCHFDGFPRALTSVNNCVFRPFTMGHVAQSNSVFGSWNNLWPHNTLAGIRSIDNIKNCKIEASVWGTDGSITFNNVNDMQTSVGTYYNGVVTANLPEYNMNIKLNVDCNTLNLGIFQSGPPHGFRNATISANTIYAKGSMPNAYVQVNCDTKIYCENYCNVCFHPSVPNISSVLQPVILINNYDHYNSSEQRFFGGLTRIGSQSTRTGPIKFILSSSACVFINNTVLSSTHVDNSILFLGSNVRFVNTPNVNVVNGGLIVDKLNWSSHASEIQSRMDRGHLAWNIWDSGPWGSQSLFNYCINV